MSGPSQPGGRSPGGDDGWGSATTVRGGAPRKPVETRKASAPPRRAAQRNRPAVGGDDWSAAGPAPREQQRANKAAGAAQRRTERSLRDLERHRALLARPPERGLRAWQALLVVIVIAVLGGLIDTVGAIEIQGGFNIGIVVASVIGILIVKRSHMFPVVIAPPIVYTLGAAFQYYLKASSGNANKAKLDAAANYLVYGFPAIAAATAAVLIIAGIRMIIRK